MIMENPVLTRPRAKSFRALDGKRIAVVILHDRIQSVLCGTARYVQMAQDRFLQVRVDNGQQPGNPVFEIRQSDWSGGIVADDEFGCDYQVRFAVTG